MSSISLAISRINRSPYQTMVAILILTMTLFLTGVFFILAAGSHVVLNYFETRPQVIGYFKREIEPTDESISALRTKLQATGVVSEVQYTSKEQALELYRQDNQDYPLLLEGVTANILPASIEVSAIDPSHLKSIADLLKTDPDIQSVQFPEDIVAPFTLWTHSLRILGISLVAAHIVITFMTILLIISVKVANRRDEVTTFQMLGATPGYISAPFIFEGIIYGVVSGFIAWGACYLAILYSMPFWVTLFGSILTDIALLPPPLSFMFALLGGMLGLGSFIGGMGGLLAVRRFLKN